MSNFTLRLAKVVGIHDETPMVMIDAAITHELGRFHESSLPFEAVARDGSHTVPSFRAFLSPNGKALHAYFTTDAFDVFSGSFNLDFGKIGRPIGTIPNVDVSTLIPLAPKYAALDLPHADNAWLASLG